MNFIYAKSFIKCCQFLTATANIHYKVLNKNMMCTTDSLDKTRYVFGSNIVSSISGFSHRSGIVINPESDGIYETVLPYILTESKHEIILTKKYNLDKIETYFYFNKDVISDKIDNVQSDIINRSAQSILDLKPVIKENLAIWNEFVKKMVINKKFMNFVTEKKLHIPKFYFSSHDKIKWSKFIKHFLYSPVYRSDDSMFTVSTIENINLNDNTVYTVQLYPDSVPNSVVVCSETNGVYKTDAVKIVNYQNKFDIDELLSNNSNCLIHFINNNDLSKIIDIIDNIKKSLSVKYTNINKYINFAECVKKKNNLTNQLEDQQKYEICINTFLSQLLKFRYAHKQESLSKIDLVLNNLRNLKSKESRKEIYYALECIPIVILTFPLWLPVSPIILWFNPEFFLKYFTIPVILIIILMCIMY